MKSKELGTIRQLFTFVGERNVKMRFSIILAVLGELFGMGPFLMVAVLADALYHGTATPILVLSLCGVTVNCHDFIMQLEDGYDTMAGDAGDRLSGGERQRITIARAMLKQASVIILDEATAYAGSSENALEGGGANV